MAKDQLSAEAHLAAGQVKLDQLRLQFLEYLDRKEREVLRRQEVRSLPQGQSAGQGSARSDPGGELDEW